MNRTNLQPARGREYYARYIAYYTKKNYLLLVLGAIFIAGVLLGTLLLRSADGETLELLSRLVGSSLKKRGEHSMMQNFLTELSSSMIFIVLLFIGGFCAISHPLILALPLFHGLGVGLSAASVYADQGIGAVGFVALFMLPGNVLTTIAILICCQESLRLAGSFFSVMGTNKPAREFYPLRIYLARYFSCTVLCVISAFLEAVIYFGFANYFVFS